MCVCVDVGVFLNANSYIEYQFSGHFLLLRLWGNVLRIRTANLQLSKRNLEFTKVRKLSHYHTLIFVDILVNMYLPSCNHILFASIYLNRHVLITIRKYLYIF